jgi:hypothetical protein
MFAFDVSAIALEAALVPVRSCRHTGEMANVGETEERRNGDGNSQSRLFRFREGQGADHFVDLAQKTGFKVLSRRNEAGWFFLEMAKVQ